MNQIGTSCFSNYHEPNNFITFLHVYRLLGAYGRTKNIFCMYMCFWVHTEKIKIFCIFVVRMANKSEFFLHLYGADGKKTNNLNLKHIRIEPM